MELTNTKKKVIIAFIAVIVAIGIALTVYNPDADAAEDVVKENVKIATSPNREWTPPTYEGCANLQEWFDTLKNRRAEYEGLSNRLQTKYKDFITEEQILELDELEQACINSSTLCRLDENDVKINNIETVLQEKKEAYEAEQARIAAAKVANSRPRSYSSGGSGNNFKRDGIWRDNQYTYSWYSSNVLYHYRTKEWTPGSDGVYRDCNGRVCAASDDYALGTIVNTEKFGEVVITDTGVGSSGKLDIYTNF